MIKEINEKRQRDKEEIERQFEEEWSWKTALKVAYIYIYRKPDEEAKERFSICGCVSERGGLTIDCNHVDGDK